MADLAFKLRSVWQDDFGPRIVPGYLDDAIGGRLEEHKGPFQLCHRKDVGLVDCGPWRTKAEGAADTFAARIVTESKAGAVWEISSQAEPQWWLRVRAFEYLPGQQALDAAKTQLGVKYRFGTAQPGVSFDCSGLTMWAWACAGVSLPHNAELQRQACTKVVNPVEGDLVMFDFRAPYSGAATHVGLWTRPGILLDTRNPDGEPVAYREIEKPPRLLGFWRPRT